MINRNERLFKEKLNQLERLMKEEDNSEEILELLKSLENPIADESLDTFRREFQKNIARRAKA